MLLWGLQTEGRQISAVLRWSPVLAFAFQRKQAEGQPRGSARMVEFTDLSKIDPAVIAREVEALKAGFHHRDVKAAFTYRSFSHDMDLLINDLLRDEPANPLNLPLHGIAEKFLEDCYYEKGAIEPLVKIYSGHRYQRLSTFERVLQHLEAARRHDLIERLWFSIARNSRVFYFYQRPGRDHGNSQQVEQFKNDALEGYAHAVAWMTRLGRNEAAEKLTEERDALREERFAPVVEPTDSRRIDETVFWELIVQSRSRAGTTLEQLLALGESLRAFKAPDIKRFGSHYAKLMKRLHHWNVWALAYAARGGCSDSAFEEFRAWLILQGDPALISVAIVNPVRAAERVPRNPELPDGPGLSSIQEAYLQRAGSWLELPSIDIEKPKGKPWTEEAFETTFPDLMRHYASAPER